MPTSCKLAPFGISATRVRSQPSRQAALDVKVIHKIVELELELLNIVHDHYGRDSPTVTPIYIPVRGIGCRKHIPVIHRSPPEPVSHSEGPVRYVRKMMSRFQADRLSSPANAVEQTNRYRDISKTARELAQAWLA